MGGFESSWVGRAFHGRIAIPKGQVKPASYPKYHIKESVSPGPGPNMLSTVHVDKQGDENETGDVQVVV